MLQALQRWREFASICCACMLDLAFLVNAHWLLRDGAVKQTILAAGADAPLFDHHAPERSLVAAMRERGADTGRVLMLGTNPPALAELGARGRNVSWYSPGWEAAALRANGDAQGAAWAALLVDERVAHVLLRPEALNGAQRAALARLGAERKLVVGDAEWWAIPQGPAP